MGIVQGHRDNDTGLKKIYYKCNLKRRSSWTLCSSKNLVGEKLEECVLDSLIEMAQNKKNFLDRIRKVRNENNKVKEDKIKKSNIEKQILTKTKQLNGLIEKLAIADDLTDIFVNKIRTLKTEIAELEKDLNSINTNIENNSAEDYDVEFISALLDKCINIKNEPIENQRRFINYLIVKIDYNNDTELLTIHPIDSCESKKKTI